MRAVWPYIMKGVLIFFLIIAAFIANSCYPDDAGTWNMEYGI